MPFVEQQPAPFKLTLSMVAAAMVAVLAFGVMVAGILFVRSDDRSDSMSTANPVQAMNLPSASTAIQVTPSAPPVIVIGDAPLPPVSIPAASAAAPVIVAKPVTPVAAAPVVAVARPTTPAAPVAPAPRAATPKKSGNKSVEDILNELGEEQLRR
jgi:hypothetical protein